MIVSRREKMESVCVWWGGGGGGSENREREA